MTWPYWECYHHKQYTGEDCVSLLKLHHHPYNGCVLETHIDIILYISFKHMIPETLKKCFFPFDLNIFSSLNISKYGRVYFKFTFFMCVDHQHLITECHMKGAKVHIIH